jgi:hypothetical protein
MRWLCVSWSGWSWRYPVRRRRTPARRGVLALLPAAALVLAGGCMNVGDAPAHPAPRGTAGQRLEGDRRGADPGRQQRFGGTGEVGARPDGAHGSGARLPEPSASPHARERDRSVARPGRTSASPPPSTSPAVPTESTPPGVPQSPPPATRTSAPPPSGPPSEPPPPSQASPPPSGQAASAALASAAPSS